MLEAVCKRQSFPGKKISSHHFQLFFAHSVLGVLQGLPAFNAKAKTA
jgi:hypothetical protein